MIMIYSGLLFSYSSISLVVSIVELLFKYHWFLTFIVEILVIFRKYGLKTHIENFCKIWVRVLTTFKILNMGMGNNSNMGDKVRNMGMGIRVETHMPIPIPHIAKKQNIFSKNTGICIGCV